MQGELVGVSEAARQLGVHKSTISRNVTAGIIPNHGSDDEPLVNVEEAREARDRELDPTKQNNAAGRVLGESDAAAELDEAPPAAEENTAGESHSPVADSSLLRHRATREEFDAKRARLAYEREAGLLVYKADVNQALVDAARTCRDAGLRLSKRLAPELAAISDPAEIERRMNEELRALFDGLATAMQGEAKAQ